MLIDRSRASSKKKGPEQSGPSSCVRMATGVAQADGSIREEPSMDVADVGRAVAYMASLPPDANVLTMTVMAAGMPFVGRG